MISYSEAKDKADAVIALTGLDHPEFEQLLKFFEVAWQSHREEYLNKRERTRKPGGGRKPVLSSLEDPLLFI